MMIKISCQDHINLILLYYFIFQKITLLNKLREKIDHQENLNPALLSAVCCLLSAV